MFQECKFNPKTDIKAVEQTGWVDLAKANSMNSIPAQLQANDLSFNGIDNPNSIAGRPADIFEAGQAARAILDYKPPKKDAE